MHRIAGPIAALVGALLLGAAAPVWAQVASPEIAPVGVRILGSRASLGPMLNVVPENPAALQWGTPSRIVAGWLQGDKNDIYDGESRSYNGTLAGFRWVQKSVALGAEVAQFEANFPSQTAPAGAVFAPHLDKHHRTVGLSFTLSDTLAVGVSSERTSQATITPPLGTDVQTTYEGWVAGASWRPGESVFFGVGYGQEEARRTLPPEAEPSHRGHTMVGFALRGGGGMKWRLEADSFEREDFKNAAGQPTQPGYGMSLFSGEAVLGNWLFGGAWFDARFHEDSAGLRTQVQGYTGDFGYVPLPGLSFTARLENSRVDYGTTRVSEETIRSVMVGWQF